MPRVSAKAKKTRSKAAKPRNGRKKPASRKRKSPIVKAEEALEDLLVEERRIDPSRGFKEHAVFNDVPAEYRPFA